MSESSENRKSQPTAPSSPDTETRSEPGLLFRVPARLWFPIGFVGFFFTIGGWNQLASTWLNLTDTPIAGADLPIGLAVGSTLLLLCTLMGFLTWRHDRNTRQKTQSRDWKREWSDHGDDIRFP